MAENTKNLNLKKPASEDFYNVEDFNENFQKIDDFVETVPKLKDGKISNENLPAMDYISISEKGKPNGVAPLTADGKVDPVNLPAMNYIPTSEKGQANGVAPLDANGKVPTTHLPATNDQTPTYTESSTLTALTSGEKLSLAFGKIKKAITELISHLKDTTSHITSTERNTWNGKANASHSHDDRYYTETEVDNKLTGKANSNHSHSASEVGAAEFITGTYTGDDIVGTKYINLGFAPSAVFVIPSDGILNYTKDGADYYCGGLATKDVPCSVDGKKIIEIISNYAGSISGFTVGQDHPGDGGAIPNMRRKKQYTYIVFK